MHDAVRHLSPRASATPFGRGHSVCVAPRGIVSPRVNSRLGLTALAALVTQVLSGCGGDSTGPGGSGPGVEGNVLAVTAGGSHSCALRTDGVAFCWGRNDHGQLGDGSTTNRARPVQVTGGVAFTAISAGLKNTCAVTSGGQGYCWGDNTQLQSGGSPTAAVTTPRPLNGAGFATISAGQDVGCGLAGGAGYCWGTGYLGSVDLAVVRDSNPVAVIGGPWSTISTSANHNCALTTAGVAFCWGVNARGLLGDGTTETRPQPTAVAGGHAFATISAGVGHVCATATDGGTYCWGINDEGQLGTGSPGGSSLVPARVSGSQQFTAVSAGELHTCAVIATGEAYCWGRNNLGQLGTGDATQRTAPTRVVGTARYTSVSAAGGHSCGVTTTHHVLCWGSNTYGELGTGSVGTGAQSPVEVVVP